MKILFIASELTPIAKVGGLGDVAGALPQALRKLGVDIQIMIPRYEQIKKKDLTLVQKKIPVNFGSIREKVSLYKTKISGTPVFLIDNRAYLSRGPIYGDTSAFVSTTGEAKRFLFFSQCIVRILHHLRWQPDIIHCQDWHTSLVPVLAKLHGLPQETLLTIHNLANQGSFDQKKTLSFLGIDPKKITDKQIKKNILTKDKHSNMNLFQQGILSADLINTVSKTYAKEIVSPPLSAGLEKATQKRKNNLYGIVNGIDIDRFNPSKNPHIPHKYSPKNITTQKRLNKHALLSEMNLVPSLHFSEEEGIHSHEVCLSESRLSWSRSRIGAQSGRSRRDASSAEGKCIPSSEQPLFGIVSRLTDQKGIDLIARSIPTIVKNGGQFVYLGQGAPELEAMLEKAKKKYPGSVAGKIAFDAKLAQRIYAASDIFLMPSKFEPCGLGQMIAMRYGTVPIVRKTGGLKDTVINNKTGFVFTKYSQKEMNKTILRAMRAFKDKKKWNRLQKNEMKQDLSWNKSAREYLKLYKKLINIQNSPQPTRTYLKNGL